MEVLLALGILSILSMMGSLVYGEALDKARLTRAIAEIRTLEKEVAAWEIDRSTLPEDLAAIGRDGLLDPWGRPYVFVNFAAAGNKAKPRKDRFLVPVNSTYDLYSKGQDGESKAPFTARMSHDDVVRAADGAFVGLAVEF